MKLQRIGPEMLEGIWPLVDKYIKDATARSNGRHSPMTVFNGVFNEIYELWLVINDEADNRVKACIVTQGVTYPTGMKALEIIIAAGDSRKEWAHMVVETLEEWAIERGCNLLEIFALKGWAREFTEYKLTHVVLEKWLSTEGTE
jgi:hypothetical protein